MTHPARVKDQESVLDPARSVFVLLLVMSTTSLKKDSKLGRIDSPSRGNLHVDALKCCC